MTIRTARAEDCAAIGALFREAVAPAHRPFTIHGCAGYETYLAEQIRAADRGGDHRCWVADDAGVRGAAEMRVLGDVWFLNNFGVRRAEQGQGVGRSLLGAAVDAGLRADHATFMLDVFASNERARAWYMRCGLREVSRTVYATLPLPEGVPSPRAAVGGLAQARAVHGVFGFARITVRGERVHDVGLLGDRWFRLGDVALLDDPAALAALRRLEAARSLLLVVPDAAAIPAGAHVVGESIRLRAPLSDVAEALTGGGAGAYRRACASQLPRPSSTAAPTPAPPSSPPLAAAGARRPASSFGLPPAFLSPDDPAWTAALARAEHDFYARPCFVALDAAWGGGEAVAYHDAERGVLIPLVRRTVDAGPLGLACADAASPYGYGGIVSPAHRDDVRDAVEAFVRAGRAAGLVSSFLRLHPILHADLPSALEAVPGCSVVAHGPTVSVAVDEDEGAWIANLPSRSLRRNLRKLERAGFRPVFDAPDADAVFLRCYAASMHRLDAACTYRYDAAYFAQLRACLGREHTICVVVDTDGAPACAGLFTEYGGVAQYHLSGTDPAYASDAPTQVLIRAGRAWARERGARVLHLGGGVGGEEDSLFAFKARFAHHFHTFTTVRIVHDPARYAVLTRAWQERAGGRAPADSGFFPAYRAPA